MSGRGDRVVAIFDWESLRLQHTAVALGEVAAMHDKAQFGMRRRLASDGPGLAATI